MKYKSMIMTACMSQLVLECLNRVYWFTIASSRARRRTYELNTERPSKPKPEYWIIRRDCRFRGLHANKKKTFFFISSVLFPNNNYNKTSYLKQKKNVENLWKACETTVKYFKSRVEVRALNGVRLRPTGPDLKFSRRNCIHDYTVLKRTGRKPFFRCVKNKFRYISHA